MSKVNDGGPAFPAREYNDSDPQGYPTIYMTGMTLRDYFAGQAMIALGPKYIQDKVNGYNAWHLTREAREIADALIDALSEENS